MKTVLLLSDGKIKDSEISLLQIMIFRWIQFHLISAQIVSIDRLFLNIFEKKIQADLEKN